MQLACGTPAWAGFLLERVLSTWTLRVLLDKNDSNIIISLIGTFSFSSLWRRPWCQTHSIAFSISRNIVSIFHLLLALTQILFVNNLVLYIYDKIAIYKISFLSSLANGSYLMIRSKSKCMVGIQFLLFWNLPKTVQHLKYHFVIKILCFVNLFFFLTISIRIFYLFYVVNHKFVLLLYNLTYSYGLILHCNTILWRVMFSIFFV